MKKKIYLFAVLFGLICFMSCSSETSSKETEKPEVKKETVAPANVVDDKIYEIKVADLADNPKKYGGKKVKLSGECTKINENIMGRNWIHIQDGSKDDFDLVITSADKIEVGKKFTMVGQVTLDKDFGAGYTYDIIVEKGELVD